MILNALASAGPIHLDLSGVDLPPWVGELFHEERGSLEAVLRTTLVVGPAVPGHPRWVVRPRQEDEPVAIEWDAEGQCLTSSANNAREMLDTTVLLARLARGTATRVEWSVPDTVDEAVGLLVDVLGNDAAYWPLAEVTWAEARDTALADPPSTWDEFRPWAEELLAQLPDGHARITDTTVTTFNPPYRARLEDEHAVLAVVPPDSDAHRAGARPGWRIPVDDPDHWWHTTPASPQNRPWRAARRYLRVTGDERTFTAVGPQGERVTWTERRPTAEPGEVVRVNNNRSGAVVVWLDWFSDDPRVTEVMDELCRAAGPKSHLVLDLRSNPGGKLLVAHRLARRFLRRRILLGSTAYSDARGGLGPRVLRWDEPGDEPQWPGRLTVLVDVHTFSAAEDFTASVQGLPHVTVLGEVTGGGIGMPGHVPLGHGLEAWFGSAIRHDRAGNPVDVRGIQPDGPLTVEVSEL